MKRAYLLGLICAWATGALAVPATNQVRLGLDVTAPVDNTVYRDYQAVSVGSNAAGVFLDLGAFSWASRVGVDALMVVGDEIVFSTDVDFIQARERYNDEDLVAYNPTNGALSMFFDGSSKGFPAAADLDAACLFINPTQFLFSVESPTALPGVGTIGASDVVLYNGVSFERLCNGADMGIPASCNLDALHYDAADFLLVFSLDTPAVINDDSGSARALWAYDIPGNSTTLLTLNNNLPAQADLTCLDEPVDTDGDWLTDFEEASGVDEAASTYPGTDMVLTPNGHTSQPLTADTDEDGMSDGVEAICGSQPRNSNDYLHVTAITKNGNDCVITWNSGTNQYYNVWAGETPFAYPAIIKANAHSTDTITSWTNSSPSATHYFYRVHLTFAL